MAESRARATAPATTTTQAGAGSVAEDARRSLIATMPVKERRIRLAGISTAVLHGGSGPPVILLHGPSGYAAHWMRVIPELANAHQVVAPDLPGHGSSYASGVPLDAKRVLDWLGELIDRTCTSPPVLVGEHLGGAIAARFACRHSERIRALVLGDTFGLEAFEPEPKFAQALLTFLSAPSAETHGRLWEHCAFNLPELQKQMSVDWEAFEAYNLDRAQQPTVSAAVHTLMEQFAVAIPPADLSRIKVPTALIWGRHDRATRLQVAEAASARYGWPLIVIEGAADDPSIEQPAAFLQALRRVIGELL